MYLPSAICYALWISQRWVVWVIIHLSLLICLQLTSVQLALAAIEATVRAQMGEQFRVPFRCVEGFLMEFSLDKFTWVCHEENSVKIQNSRQRKQHDDRHACGNDTTTGVGGGVCRRRAERERKTNTKLP